MQTEFSTDAARHAFLNGVAPALGRDALEALRDGLSENDPKMVQGKSLYPHPSSDCDRRKVEKACAVCYAIDRGKLGIGVGEVSREFDRVCGECDAALGIEKGVAYFLNWWDDAPRQEARPRLLAWVGEYLAGWRAANGAEPARPCNFF